MHLSDAGTIHIIGAGLAGLAAAERLSRSHWTVAVHEATAVAGGRCRSYYDQSTGMVIDNGTHLLLSGNHSAISLTEAIGSRSGLRGPDEAQFSFVDIANGEQWTLRFGDSRFPWWVFDKDRRVPQTAVVDYLPLARLAWATADKPIGDIMKCGGPIYDRFVGPLLLAALNIAPQQGSAKLAGAVVRETLALGGQACRPLLAYEGLGSVFVEPAITHLRGLGVTISFEDELVELLLGNGRVSRLNFAKHTVELGGNDAVILAIPPYVATNLVPSLIAPNSFRELLTRISASIRHLICRRCSVSSMGPANGYSRCRDEYRPRSVIVVVYSTCRELNLLRSSGTTLPRWPSSRTLCRRGRSSASVGRHSRRHRNRTRGDRLRKQPGTTCFLLAIGRKRACRRRSKERFVQATAPRILSNVACERPHDGRCRRVAGVIRAVRG